ncbi:MAG: WYL domain-containing protein [Eubacteriales bacterium]|nr:WYL domain-containing protein [Eubacteriales bacterium]
MAKSFGQKMKILYLMQMFTEKTDERNPITVKGIIEYLGEFGISVERKTVYDDIETLRIFGMDIVNRRERPSGFYLAGREFEVAELKILIDAVQSSRFITSRKSSQLIRKLERLVSVHDARRLQKQMSAGNRIKTANESIYYNIDKIYEALSDNRQISFQYYEWTVSKEMRLRRNGARYVVSPWEMLWKDENYYLVGLDEKTGVVKHYRVDKMLKINVEKNSRNGEELFRNFDAAQFSARTFGMFGGKEETLCLEFENRYVGVIIDHFGTEVMIYKKDDRHFTTLVRVSVSSQFFGWLAGLGDGAEIISPSGVRKEYQMFLENALKKYK